MHSDHHIHVALDGIYWKDALARHRFAPNEAVIRAELAAWQAAGITLLRDGGDRFGATELAKRLAPEYGIDYRTPTFPICRRGRYGSFIGRSFDSPAEYRALVREAYGRGADFIKLMVSGIMDFDHYGVITSEPLTLAELTDMVAFAHDLGLAVMAHANGSETMRCAALAGVDSIEHGAYAEDDALAAMAERGTVWVPTLVTIANLIGDGRYPDEVLVPLRDRQAEALRRFAHMGGAIGIGSDAGAYRVLHGPSAAREEALLTDILGDTEPLQRGDRLLRERFCRGGV